MLTSIEMYLLGKLLDSATSPQAKKWVIDELKTMDSHTTNPLLKTVIEAVEAFLASAPAAAA